MSLTTTTHLNVRGNARAALTFYREVFGGEMSVVTYAQFGMPADAHGADHVVFGQVVSAEGFRIMAYDIPGEASGMDDPGEPTRREQGMTITTQPFFVSVRGETLAEVQGYWEALAMGARIVEPLAATAWSPGFGMLTDRYGVTWIVDVASGDGAE